MKKIAYIILILVIFFYVVNVFNTNISFATVNPDLYRRPSMSVKVEENEATLELMNKVIGAFQAIGSIVSVLALVLIGIKYMMGSVEQKAEYKQTMIAYIIGAILVFSISNISMILFRFAKNLGGE